MKRFRRWLFRGLAAVSFVLFVPTIYAWVRSGAGFDGYYMTQSSQSPRLISIESSDGLLQISTGVLTAPWPMPSTGWEAPRPHSLRASGRVLGFYISRTANISGVVSDWTIVSFPYWFLAALFFATPASGAVRWQRKRRAKRTVGKCSGCGYDLRATPERCPECGTIPPK
jgi:hypothetical protein